jgi:hypothetical protein
MTQDLSLPAKSCGLRFVHIFQTDAEFAEAMKKLRIRFELVFADAAAKAGQLWRELRRERGAARIRVVADLLIGAHALIQSDALMTRD